MTNHASLETLRTGFTEAVLANTLATLCAAAYADKWGCWRDLCCEVEEGAVAPTPVMFFFASHSSFMMVLLFELSDDLYSRSNTSYLSCLQIRDCRRPGGPRTRSVLDRQCSLAPARERRGNVKTTSLWSWSLTQVIRLRCQCDRIQLPMRCIGRRALDQAMRRIDTTFFRPIAIVINKTCPSAK